VEDIDNPVFWSGVVRGGAPERVEAYGELPPYYDLGRKITAIREVYEETGLILTTDRTHFGEPAPFLDYCR
jgi:8-oxo-dGTP pyrophosphatase MutT (NUDIX family)